MRSAKWAATPSIYSFVNDLKSMSSNVPSMSSNNALIKKIPPRSSSRRFVDLCRFVFGGSGGSSYLFVVKGKSASGIEAAGQSLCDAVHREDCAQKRQAGKDAHPPRNFHVAPPRGDHAAPRRRRRRNAHSQKAEGRFKQHQLRHKVRRVDDDDGQHVGQHVTAHDAEKTVS